MNGHVTVGLDLHDGDVVLVVVDTAGRTSFRALLKVGAATSLPGRGNSTGPGAVDASDAVARETADAELAAAGWTREADWVAAPADESGRTATAPVRARPRRPVVGHDEQALEALRRLTTMARGPVASAALVPVVAPRWQAAAAQLRRLVAAGQVRAVGRTTGDKVSRTLYAPVGSTWAPDDR